MKLPIVLVKWEDPYSDGNWKHTEQALQAEPMPCLSVGFLHYKDKNKVILSQSMSECNLAATFVIPARVIKKITTLKTLNV